MRSRKNCSRHGLLYADNDLIHKDTSNFLGKSTMSYCSLIFTVRMTELSALTVEDDCFFQVVNLDFIVYIISISIICVNLMLSSRDRGIIG